MNPGANPVDTLPPTTRRLLARLVRGGLADTFQDAPPARRRAVADELRTAVERLLGAAPGPATPGDEAPSREQARAAVEAFAAALAAAVETGDRLPLLRLLDADAPPAPAPLEIPVALPGHADAAALAVVYRRTMGPDREVVVRPAQGADPAADGTVVLRLTDWPPDEAFNHLPADMGGPYRFAVGFVAVLGPDGVPSAWARGVRVLALDGAFPVDAAADGGAPGDPGGLRAFVDEHPPPPEEMDAQELDAHLAALASFPSGLQLATVTRPTRSLLGMAPRAADAGPVGLEVAPWPPTSF